MKREILQEEKQITCSLAAFLYHLLEAEGMAGRRATSSSGCLRVLPVLVARGQLGCPLVVWDCKMDRMACGLHARVLRVLAQRSNGALSETRALLPLIQQAVLFCLPELAGFSRPRQDE